MSACCCSLAGTAACLTCPNRPVRLNEWPNVPPQYPFWQHPQWTAPGTFVPAQPAIAPKRTVVEEYDKDGNLIKRIITTEEGQ